MKILFDHGTPAPLRKHLIGHSVATSGEQGWDRLSNDDLLREAESVFEMKITTDQSIRHQQNRGGRRLAILVLPTTSWPIIQQHVSSVRAAVDTIGPGELRELTF